MNRRNFLKATFAAGFSLSPLLLSGCGSSEDATATPTSLPPTSPPPPTATLAPTPTPDNSIKIGFIPLTDCASVVMAETLGLYQAQGIQVTLVKGKSWPDIRDKLLTGEIHAAHSLFGMPFSVYTGVGGTAGQELQIAMLLSANGQGITLRKSMAATAEYGNLSGAKLGIEGLMKGKTPSFAMTFPGGTHDLWLRYWLAATGVDLSKLEFKTYAPQTMIDNLRINNMDGYCVGEPWNGMAVQEDLGYTHLATQDIWTDHPEKALVVNPTFAASRREDLKKVMRAILEASIWLDKLENRAEAAKVLAPETYVNALPEVIEGRLKGQYTLGGGLPDKTFANDNMLFHKDGFVNAPRTGHAIWFMSQYIRFGYLKEAPDYQKIANTLLLQDLYSEVAQEMKITLPQDDMQPFTLKLDNVTFDPADPAASLLKYQK